MSHMEGMTLQQAHDYWKQVARMQAIRIDEHADFKADLRALHEATVKNLKALHERREKTLLHLLMECLRQVS